MDALAAFASKRDVFDGVSFDSELQVDHVATGRVIQFDFVR